MACLHWEDSMQPEDVERICGAAQREDIARMTRLWDSLCLYCFGVFCGIVATVWMVR